MRRFYRRQDMYLAILALRSTTEDVPGQRNALFKLTLLSGKGAVRFTRVSNIARFKGVGPPRYSGTQHRPFQTGTS